MLGSKQKQQVRVTSLSGLRRLLLINQPTFLTLYYLLQGSFFIKWKLACMTITSWSKHWALTILKNTVFFYWRFRAVISVAISAVWVQAGGCHRLPHKLQFLACGPFERLHVMLWRKNERNVSGLDHPIWTRYCWLLVIGFSCVLKSAFENGKKGYKNNLKQTLLLHYCTEAQCDNMKCKYRLSPKHA